MYYKNDEAFNFETTEDNKMTNEEIKQLWLESGKTLIIEFRLKDGSWRLLTLTNPLINPNFDDTEGSYRFKADQDFSIINDKVKKAWEDSGKSLIVELTSVDGGWVIDEDPWFHNKMIYRIEPVQTTENDTEEEYKSVYPLSAMEQQIGGDHYKNMAIQPIEFCHRNNLGCIEHSVIKYLCRYKFKNGLQDLKKARHFIDILIELEYGKQEAQQ